MTSTPAASIVRSRAMLTRALDRRSCETVPDGAFVQEGGVIVEVSTYEALAKRFPTLPVHGSERMVAVPGFVNAHHHVGLTPFQLGAPDLPLELWAIARMAARDVDPYLDTLYSAFEMIGSGVTTVQHIQDTVDGDLPAVAARFGAIIRAYGDVGMRASVCYGIADQNHFAHSSNAEFLAGLPTELRRRAAEALSRLKVGLEGSIELFQSLFRAHEGSRRIRVQLAPANLHWCSDAALAALGETARSYGVPMHMHLLETPSQHAYAKSRAGGGAIAHLERFGLIGPGLTLGHAVWLDPDEIVRVAETGTSICHNCSSNMRLRSGRAPVNTFEAAGINLAIGIDEAGLNDDRDMLQEMRLVLNAHRRPGLDDAVPGVGQVFRMATIGGARTTGFGDSIGEIAVGKAADVTLFDWSAIAFPYLDSVVPIADAILYRAKPRHVALVICDGVVILEDGVFRTVDRVGALEELHRQMLRAALPDERDRADLARALMPYVRALSR